MKPWQLPRRPVAASRYRTGVKTKTISLLFDLLTLGTVLLMTAPIWWFLVHEWLFFFFSGD
jgi:hypothetical protein